MGKPSTGKSMKIKQKKLDMQKHKESGTNGCRNKQGCGARTQISKSGSVSSSKHLEFLTPASKSVVPNWGAI